MRKIVTGATTNAQQEGKIMAARVPWFERRFNFDFPVGWHPDLIEHLRGTPARLEERLRALSADVLTRRERATT
jgi:hypothetical protein